MKNTKQINLMRSIIREAVESGFMAATPARTPSKKMADKAALPAFELEKLKQQKTSADIFAYINGTSLKNSLVGEGSSRVVYKYSEQYALKVAKDEGAGAAQNQAEAQACSIAETKELFTKVAEIGPGHMWLLVEFAAAINEQIFEKLSGMNWNTFINALAAAIPGAVKQVRPENQAALQSLANNKLFKQLVMTVNTCQYKPGDLAKLDSWGITPNGRLVIVDSGFTEAVSMAHYKQAAATKK